MKLPFFPIFLLGIHVAAAQSPPLPADVITPDEVRKFGEDIEREFRESGPDFFVNSIDVVRMVDIATAGQPGDDQTKTSFRSGASSGFHRNLAQGMERFSSYKLLRVITTNERPQLVFRCLSDEGSLNYHVLDLERNRRSRIRVVDMYVMISGEKMSETLRRAYLAIAAEADRSLLSRLTLGQGAWIKHGKDIQELARLVREGKPEAALKVYNSLPESLRTEKLILLMRLMAVSGGDEKAYLSAIEAFEKHFPNDPSLALISIDGYVLKKQPRKAIASIEKLDRFVGGDPYLLLLQAGQYVELKERDKARELARKAIEQEPSLPGTYDFLLGLALEDKNHNETARLLNLTEKNLKVNMLGAVSEAKEYEAFLDSSAGKKWKEDHQPK